MVEIWDEHLPVQNAFAPDWENAQVGDTVSVVVEVLATSPSGVAAKVIPGGQLVRLGKLANSVDSGCRLTAPSLSVVAKQPFLDLHPTAASFVFQHLVPSVDRMFDLVELCAGAGCSAVGFQFAGWRHVAAVEHSEKLASFHTKLHPDVPVILSDVNDVQVAAKLLQLTHGGTTIMAGIACQPYSRAGMMSGSNDSRSSTLPAVLKLGHFLQSPLIILECVPLAQSNGFVRAHLQALAAELGYHLSEVQLKLEEQWTSNRHRWWMVATRGFGSIPLSPPMPMNDWVVADLMPYIKEWPESDLCQLELTHEELQAFAALQVPLRKCIVRMHEKLPTALHSWGSQTIGCACGCRPAGLPAHMLRDKGVFAQLLPIMSDKHDGSVRYRHLHAQEVALLVGFPHQGHWSDDARLNLCAMGQQASPIQAAWVAAQTKAFIDQTLNLTPAHPNSVFSDLTSALISQAKSLYPPLPNKALASQCK